MVIMDNELRYDYSAAAREGNLNVLRQCQKKDANKRDTDGMTPVHWAALYGNLEALKVLVTGGGDPDKPNNEGSSAVHLAATNGQLHCLIFLTNFGSNVHAINDVGDTPMNEATNKRRLECVRHLEAIVTHQVSQDRMKVEKMQQKAKKDAEKRIKRKAKYLKKLDKDFEKKSAKLKYLGAPISSQQNFFGPMNSDDMNSQKLTFSQLAGMPHSNGYEEEDDENLDDDTLSADSFRRVEEEFLTRKSLLSDDIVFERTDNHSSVVTENTDLAEFPTKSAMMASLNSLHTRNHHRANGARPYDKKMTDPFIVNGHKQNDLYMTSNGHLRPGRMYHDNRRLSVDTTRSNNTQRTQKNNMVTNKGFSRGQHLGSSQSKLPTNLPQSKRTIRPVGFLEIHMAPLYTFLHSLELDEFREVFLREKIDLGACLLCDENDLREIGLPLGPRKKLLDAITRRNQVLASNSERKDLYDAAV